MLNIWVSNLCTAGLHITPIHIIGIITVGCNCTGSTYNLPFLVLPILEICLLMQRCGMKQAREQRVNIGSVIRLVSDIILHPIPLLRLLLLLLLLLLYCTPFPF